MNYLKILRDLKDQEIYNIAFMLGTWWSTRSSLYIMMRKLGAVETEFTGDNTGAGPNARQIINMRKAAPQILS